MGGSFRSRLSAGGPVEPGLMVRHDELPKIRQSGARQRAYRNLTDATTGVGRRTWGTSACINLVVDEQLRHVVRTDFAQHPIHRLDLFITVGRRGIDYMKQQIRIGGFLQGGRESLYELVRQIADKSHGVGNDKMDARGPLQPTGQGVQGRKQLVGGERLSACQGIEQRGLAGIGIAHQRN